MGLRPHRNKRWLVGRHRRACRSMSSPGLLPASLRVSQQSLPDVAQRTYVDAVGQFLARDDFSAVYERSEQLIKIDPWASRKCWRGRAVREYGERFDDEHVWIGRSGLYLEFCSVLDQCSECFPRAREFPLAQGRELIYGDSALALGPVGDWGIKTGITNL